MLVLFCVLCFGVQTLLADSSTDLLAKFHQTDYRFTYVRMETVHYDKNYFSKFVIVTNKYNRTQAATNWTFILTKNVDFDLQLLVQSYKFTSNEFRTFPMRFQLPFCTVINSDACGMKEASRGRLNCPMKKNVVNGLTNFFPKTDQFPPLVPSGQYMVHMAFIYQGKEIAAYRAYGDIDRPFTK